jgi:hypothetical protein
LLLSATAALIPCTTFRKPGVWLIHACSYLIVSIIRNKKTMFTKKGHADLRKSSAKFLDSKRESPKRLKDLRTVLGQLSRSLMLSLFLILCFGIVLLLLS